MRYLWTLLCALLLFCTSAVAEHGETAKHAETDKTVLLTIHFPPYIINEDNSKLSGFDVEVAREAFQRMHEPLEIKIVPWRRALASTEQGVANGILTCSPRQIFLMSDPISTATDALFLNADHNFRDYPISSVEDLIKYPDLKIGGVAGYRQLKLLDQYGLSYDTSPDDSTAFKKLFAGRINVFLTIKEFGEYTLQQLQLSRLIKIIPIRSKQYHICFSKARPDTQDLIQRFNKALAAMQADGTYQAIHDRYK
ncbi:substrate-binding periplasmic protein [Terasakiella sp.]|uniref:substrate-binding periplasmic protein n=1 Tax=Terasakiella sp. TaxID=2034861 RepID=UPI003AA86E6D